MLNSADRDALHIEAARLSTLRVETLLADQPQRLVQVAPDVAHEEIVLGEGDFDG